MLHFEVQDKQGQRSDYADSVLRPKQYPCYVLVHNYDWSDSGFYTWFCLYYFKDSTTKIQKIGEFRLLCEGENNTKATLQQSFDGELDSRYCSLGNSTSYYKHMKEVVRDKGELHELLRSLRDCTYLPDVYEYFEHVYGFQESLMRDMESIDALNDGQKIYEGADLEKLYSFSFRYQPDYDTTGKLYTDWDVYYPYFAPSFLRTKGIIGENGVGKTLLLSQLAKDLVNKNRQNFDHIPEFSSLMVLCSTPLDKYPESNSDDKFYTCRSLEQDFRYTAQGLVEAINGLYQRPTLHGLSLSEIWSNLIAEYFGVEFRDSITTIDLNDWNVRRIADAKHVAEAIRRMSSGEVHILTLITHLLANIHMKSLIIVDEPEVHLHPHYIMEFMSVLGRVLHKFKSYAIIATHSPLVVREMVDKNVFRLQKVDGDIPQIAAVPFCTFGEDISTLYKRIFGFDERVSILDKAVKVLVDKGLNYEKIVSLFDKEAILSTESRMLIRDIIENKEAE